VREARGGLHEGSVVTTATEMSLEDDSFWDGLFRELETIGLSGSTLPENKDVIKAFFRDKWMRGELEEQPPSEDLTSSELPSIKSFALSGTTARLDDRLAEEPTLDDTSVSRDDLASPPVVFHNPFGHLDETPTAAFSRNPNARLNSVSSSSGKRRKSRLGSALFKLFGSDAALLKAASENDAKQVADLIRKGANVNVKDRWGWAPMSMAAYGGYADIAKLLIEAGADLDYQDVDNDKPIDLATSKGHTDVVLLIQEEMTRRAIEEG
jgi:Ankyrin repeats (many copies)